MTGGRLRALTAAHALIPLAIAIPVLIGLAGSVVQILSTRHPDLGFGHTITNDARALAAGHPLYAEPGQGYTGMLYAPLFPVLLAPLYLIMWWDGWALLAGAVSGVGTAVLVGSIAASGPGRSTPNRLIGGVAVGGTAWWLVRAIPRDQLYGPRADQLAWFLAMSGMCVLALGVARRWPRVWPSVLLLSGAVWTKQTTIGAVLAAVMMATWWVATRAMSTGLWVRFVGGLVLLNGLTFAAVMVATDGWFWFFLVDLPNRHFSDPAVAPYLSELGRVLLVPLAAVVVAGGLALRERASRPSASSVVSLLAALLVAFIVIQIAPSWLGRRKQGGAVNHYIGLVWALGLLLALAHRQAQQSGRALVAGAAVYASLAAVAFIPAAQRAATSPGAFNPAVSQRIELTEIDPIVIEYASSHLVYDAFVGVISPERTDEAFPAQGNRLDMLAAGETPDYLMEALIERRFDAVTLTDTHGVGYASMPGLTTGGYLPALNGLMEAGYVVGANGAPPPLLGRRPEPVDLSWARRCFDTDQPARCVRQGPPTDE